jgi:hypothetical protein
MAREDTLVVRFAVFRKDEDSQVPEGVLAVAYRLLDGSDLEAHDRERLEEIIGWFRKNLPIPNRFARSTKPNTKPRAISWLKPSAAGHMSRMHELELVLSGYGYNVRQLRTSRPGYVVYEDEFQLVAEPFSETPV